MAEVNTDLVQQLEQTAASFEAAGPAFEDDAKAARAKLAKVKGEKKATPAKTTAKSTAKKGKG